MGKRFTETTIWDDDWFYELPSDYKLFWFYIKDNCNHAGIWQPKVRAFKSATNSNIDLNTALSLFNDGKDRIRVLFNGKWYIEDFFIFQYSPTPSLRNRVHKSALQMYVHMGIDLFSVRGLIAIKETKTKTISLAESLPMFSGSSAELELKDKEQDKEQYKDQFPKEDKDKIKDEEDYDYMFDEDEEQK